MHPSLLGAAPAASNLGWRRDCWPPPQARPAMRREQVSLCFDRFFPICPSRCLLFLGRCPPYLTAMEPPRSLRRANLISVLREGTHIAVVDKPATLAPAGGGGPAETTSGGSRFGIAPFRSYGGGREDQGEACFERKHSARKRLRVGLLRSVSETGGSKVAWANLGANAVFAGEPAS